MGDLEKILADLERHKHALDLDRHQLGEKLTAAAEDGVRESFHRQSDPSGSRWPELSARYAEFKRRYYPGAPMGIKDRVMVQGLDGETEVSPGEADWTFGRTERERTEAGWFQEGSALDNRPPRPFVGFTAGSKAKSKEIADDHFEGQV